MLKIYLTKRRLTLYFFVIIQIFLIFWFFQGLTQNESAYPQNRIWEAGILLVVSFSLMFVLYRQENAYRAEEGQQRLQAVTDQMAEGIIVLDKNDSICFINPAGYLILGIYENDALGQPIDTFIDLVFKGIPEPIAAFKEKFHQQQFLSGEITIVLVKKQTTATLEYTIRPLRSDLQQGYLIVFRDMTERKQTEHFLIKARDEAEAGAKAKSQFLASMSHEIRTPMNAVIGMTSLLSLTRLTAEQREYVETIRLGGESLLTIINDILDFSKLDSGHLELDIHTFDLQTCVEEAIELLSNRAVIKGLELISLIDPGVPRIVSGDSTRLRQILVNLISNAVKFTDDGEVFVAIKLAEPGRVLFEIRDTGIGIPLERINRLFKPFTQVDASTSRRFGGTGLGLAICKRLVEVMDGRIWVESVPGEGSLFSFEINLPPAQQNATQEEKDFESALMGKHVLVVDDHASNRRVLSLMLRNWGITSELFSSPADVLNRLEREHFFDMIILDYQMPNMDGLELAQSIHLMPSCTDIPLILLSSLDNLDEIKQNHRQLFAEIVNKPVRQSRMYDALAVVLAKAPRRVKSEQYRVTTRLDEYLGERLPLRILVAEDNPVNQRLALLVLQKMGYRADAVGNGVEVVQALDRQFYDIIFMDVHMPELDGLAATKAILQKWTAAEERPRIIAMTANAMPGDHKDCLLAGMDDYLSKPIRLEQVQMMLEKWGGVRAPQTAVQQVGTKILDWDTILDQEIISVLHAMGPDAFVSLRDLFITEGQETLNNLKEEINKGASPTITHMAHSLKGSALNLGALYLSEAAHQVELASKNGEDAALIALLNTTSIEFNRTKAALENMG